MKKKEKKRKKQKQKKRKKQNPSIRKIGQKWTDSN